MNSDHVRLWESQDGSGWFSIEHWEKIRVTLPNYFHHWGQNQHAFQFHTRQTASGGPSWAWLSDSTQTAELRRVWEEQQTEAFLHVENQRSGSDEDDRTWMQLISRSPPSRVPHVINTASEHEHIEKINLQTSLIQTPGDEQTSPVLLLIGQQNIAVSDTLNCSSSKNPEE